MSKRRAAIITMAICLVVPVSGVAQHGLGIYFDETATLSSVQIQSEEPFSVYIVASGPGFEAWAFALDVDSRLEVLNRVLHPAHVSGFQDDPENDRFSSFHPPACVGGGLSTLVRYDVVLSDPLANSDVTFCFTPFDDSCTAAWAYCNLAAGDCFDIVGNGCAVVNPSGIPTAAASWGLIKGTWR